MQIIEQLQHEFPGAEIIGSTFDDYIDHLMPFINNLPVFDQEIGDTWY